MTTLLFPGANLRLLRQLLYNPAATFHPGQWETIENLVIKHSRLLLVQRTDWGKSIVYFLATYLLRQQQAGPTLLISPLLALIRNQIAAAQRLDIKAATINSSNLAQWPLISKALANNKIDILLISPERLANKTFREQMLLPIMERIGLFVVDEAHCISDWGHDFRPDYRQIKRIIPSLPPNIPLLATTATATNRVINDIKEQFGKNIKICRGSLARTSLQLQNIYLPSQAERMAWLVEYLPQLPDSNIIYTLTIRDSQRLAKWLQVNGIAVQAYHSELTTTRV